MIWKTLRRTMDEIEQRIELNYQLLLNDNNSNNNKNLHIFIHEFIIRAQ